MRRLLKSLKIKSFPSLVLVSPDGRSIFLPVAFAEHSFEQQLRSVLNGTVSSPKQIEILNKVSETFGVVLLIEGNDPNETKKSMIAATVATEKINVQILKPDGSISNGYGEINLLKIPMNKTIQFERYGFVNPIKIENNDLFCYFTH